MTYTHTHMSSCTFLRILSVDFLASMDTTDESLPESFDNMIARKAWRRHS